MNDANELNNLTKQLKSDDLYTRLGPHINATSSQEEITAAYETLAVQLKDKTDLLTILNTTYSFLNNSEQHKLYGQLTSKNYYSRLGLAPTASSEEISKAYKKLSLKVHPDRAPIGQYCKFLFTNLSDAYKCLADNEKRNQYDKEIKNQIDSEDSDKTREISSAQKKAYLNKNEIAAFLKQIDQYQFSDELSELKKTILTTQNKVYFFLFRNKEKDLTFDIANFITVLKNELEADAVIKSIIKDYGLLKFINERPVNIDVLRQSIQELPKIIEAIKNKIQQTQRLIKTIDPNVEEKSYTSTVSFQQPWNAYGFHLNKLNEFLEQRQKLSPYQNPALKNKRDVILNAGYLNTFDKIEKLLNIEKEYIDEINITVLYTFIKNNYSTLKESQYQYTFNEKLSNFENVYEAEKKVIACFNTLINEYKNKKPYSEDKIFIHELNNIDSTMSINDKFHKLNSVLKNAASRYVNHEINKIKDLYYYAVGEDLAETPEYETLEKTMFEANQKIKDALIKKIKSYAPQFVLDSKNNNITELHKLALRIDAYKILDNIAKNNKFYTPLAKNQRKIIEGTHDIEALQTIVDDFLSNESNLNNMLLDKNYSIKQETKELLNEHLKQYKAFLYQELDNLQQKIASTYSNNVPDFIKLDVPRIVKYKDSAIPTLIELRSKLTLMLEIAKNKKHLQPQEENFCSKDLKEEYLKKLYASILERKNEPKTPTKNEVLNEPKTLTKNDVLILALNEYIKRIKGDALKDEDIDYKRDFWFLKNSRAVNREINYHLALRLIKELSSPTATSPQNVLNNTEQYRNELKNMKKNDPNFVDRGLNSRELNDIINKGLSPK